MGDRGSIVLQYDSADKLRTREIYLYTHWGGSDIPVVVQTSLNKRWRWEDASYLARILFSELVKGHEDGETGYGIDVEPPDNEHDFLVVDFDRQEVRQEDADSRRVKARWTFEAYCAVDFEEGVGTLPDF